MLATDRSPGASRNGRKPCVGRQVSGRSEGSGGHIDQESGGGPDADSWHACQDRMRRVREDQAFDFLFDFSALASQRCQLLREARQHDGGGLSAQHDDRLFRECLDDLSGPALAQARSQFAQAVRQLSLTERRKLSRRRVPL